MLGHTESEPVESLVRRAMRIREIDLQSPRDGVCRDYRLDGGGYFDRSAPTGIDATVRV